MLKAHYSAHKTVFFLNMGNSGFVFFVHYMTKL